MPEQPGSIEPSSMEDTTAQHHDHPSSTRKQGAAGGSADQVELLPPYRDRVVAFVTDHGAFGAVFILSFLLDKLPYLSAEGLIAVVVIGWIYCHGFTAWLMDGQTIGKVINGLRVHRVGSDSVPHTLRGAAWSTGRHTVGYVIADVFLVGAWLALGNPRRRCLHDYAFGSEVSLDTGVEVPQGSFIERCRASGERFMERYDELNARTRWLFGPWKWLTKALIIIGVGVHTIMDGLGIAQAAPAAAPAEAATPLSLKATAGLWAATTVSTGIIAAGALPDSDPIASLNVVTARGLSGQPETIEVRLMHADGTNPQDLTHNEFWDGDPDLFADRRVVFSSERDGNPEIYVMNADGSQQSRLTTEPGTDFCPSWSPDGERIAFTSDRDGYHHIYVMNADGSNQTPVTTEPENQCPDWSPDGDRIAFASGRDGNAELYTARIDGSEVRRLTDDPASDLEAAWSPDGDRIAFTSDRDGADNIYVIDADGGEPTRVSDDPAHDRVPIWAPGGDALIFTSERGFDEGDGSEVYVIDLDGTNLRRLSSFNDCGPDLSTCVRE